MIEVAEFENGITMNLKNDTVAILELSKKQYLELSKKQYKSIKNKDWPSIVESFTLLMIKKLKESCGDDVDKFIILRIDPTTLVRVNFDKGTSLYTIEVYKGDPQEAMEFFYDTPVTNGYDTDLCMYHPNEWMKMYVWLEKEA